MHHLQHHENSFTTCPISFAPSDILLRLKARPMVLSVQPGATPDSKYVEDFIAGIYAQAYGARIRVHYRALMSIHDESGAILAAVGFRQADKDDLFLEQYLDQPVEDLLETPRRYIVEIGNLASLGGGESLFLFAALSAYLHSRGFTRAMVTGTAPLQRRLRRMGLRPRRHTVADPALLLHGDEDWGSYYETQPYVLSGFIPQGHQRLQTMLGTQFPNRRPRLIPRLHCGQEE